MSLAAIPAHIALIDQSGEVDQNELSLLAGALNSQIQNDFAPPWHLKATVGVYPTAPSNAWQVIIQTQLDEPGALGYHTDNNNQPIAYIEYTSEYSVTTSHEVLEMLADPFGSRMTTAQLVDGIDPTSVGLQSGTGFQVVHYLVEVCDPCEAASYPIGGVAVSDFLLPTWYRSAPGPGVSYSHTGYCQDPTQVADGGYVSFSNMSGEWYQVFNQGGQLQVQDLGTFDKSQYGSIREWADQKAREFRSQA